MYHNNHVSKYNKTLATCGMCINHIVVSLLNEHPYRTFHDWTLLQMLPWQLYMHVHPGKHRFVTFVKAESETLKGKQQWYCHFYLSGYQWSYVSLLGSRVSPRILFCKFW